MTNVDPYTAQWPAKWMADPELAPTLHYLNRFLHDIWIRTGGGQDDIAGVAGRSVIAGTGLDGGGTLNADVTLTAAPGEIDHDLLQNFVAAEHSDHSAISIVAGTALTGGGTIDGNVTLNVDETAINHDSLSGFVANEHVDHSLITLTAGTGLTGGGAINLPRSFAVDTDVVIVRTGISTYTPSNVTTTRSFDANSTTVDELADVLGTLIEDLQLD